MKLSTRGDYAVRALLELCAHEDDRPLPLSSIAERTAIPSKYLEQILMRLRSIGVVTGKRGAGGGYRLARSPRDVTVGEIVRAMDGPLAPTLCASTTAHAPCPTYRCPDESSCVMRDLWLEVRDAISAVVDRTTFADLASRLADQRASTRVMYHI